MNTKDQSMTDKSKADPKAATAKNDTPTLPAQLEETEIYYDDHHEGVSGAALIDGNRPVTFKLDHKKGFFHPADDDTERYDSLDAVLVNARIYYSKFGVKGPACTSDNGKQGFDREKQIKVTCTECPFYYGIKDFQGQGQCTLRTTVQMVALIEGRPACIQANFSQSSTFGFKQYLEKLRRKGKEFRRVTTRLASRFVNGANPFYAAEFKLHSDTPCVDISPFLDDGEGKAV